MRYVVRVRLQGGYGCVDIQGWYRTPRPHPYDETQESWWCYWVPETVYAQLQTAIQGTPTRFRFGKTKVVWEWTEFE
jgi:hypothetical protein